jgi:hypothetical protein
VAAQQGESEHQELGYRIVAGDLDRRYRHSGIRRTA